MDVLSSFKASPVTTFLVAVSIYALFGGIYRLYFSPVSKFPGPKLAALTWWYQIYYDVICRGKYAFRIKEMHDRYGPIVRINPFELHIRDSQFFDTLYVTTKRDKWPWDIVDGMEGSVFTTVPHDIHRVRRSAVDQFFSTQNVRKLQPVIQELADKAVKRLIEKRGISEVFDAGAVFSAYSNDAVMEYAFGRSERRLDAEDFDPSFRNLNRETAVLIQLLKHARWVITIMQSLPEWILQKDPTFANMVFQRDSFVEQVENTQKGIRNPSHLTIFHEILNSKLPPKEKASLRLAAEAQVIIGAGTETTAWNLTVALYYLLAEPEILLKLKEELKTAIPNADVLVPLVVLEKLPYLTGVIKEALRLSQGVAGKLSRISPKEPIQYRDWVIAPNTPVSMSTFDVHNDESIFPDPKTFKPERWIENPGLGKHLVAFMKGPRHCLGMNLAYAEMYLILSSLFRRVGSSQVRMDGDEGILELYNTDIEDITVTKQLFVPCVKDESKGVRFRVLP